MGQRTGGNDPTEVAKDRRPGAHHRPAHLGPLQPRLPLETPLRGRLVGAALLNQPSSAEPYVAPSDHQPNSLLNRPAQADKSLANNVPTLPSATNRRRRRKLR